LKLSEKIRRMPWKGNAADDMTGPSSLCNIASDLIEREPDNDEAWEAEKALLLYCFGIEESDEHRAAWEAERMR